MSDSTTSPADAGWRWSPSLHLYHGTEGSSDGGGGDAAAGDTSLPTGGPALLSTTISLSGPLGSPKTFAVSDEGVLLKLFPSQRRPHHILRSEKESFTSSSAGGEEEHHSMASDEDDTSYGYNASVPQSELYRCTAAYAHEYAALDGPSHLMAPPIRQTATRGGGSSLHSLLSADTPPRQLAHAADQPPSNGPGHTHTAPSSTPHNAASTGQPDPQQQRSEDPPQQQTTTMFVSAYPPPPPAHPQQFVYGPPPPAQQPQPMMLMMTEQPTMMYVTQQQPPPTSYYPPLPSAAAPYAAAGPPTMYPYPTASPYPTAYAPYAPPQHQPYYHQPSYMPVAYPPPPQMYYVDPHTGAMHAMGHPHYAPQQPSYPTMMMGMSATTPDPPQGSEGTAAAPQPPSLEQSEPVAAVATSQKSEPSNPPLLSSANPPAETGAPQQSTATSTTTRSRATAAVAAASPRPTAKKRASSADGRATAAAAVPHVPSFSLVPRPRDVGPTAVPVVVAVEQQQQPLAQERPAEEHPPPPPPFAVKAVPSSSSLEAVKGEMLLEQYLSAMGDPAAVRRWRHIRNVQGHVAVFSRHQAGSRLLQHILEDDAAAAVPVVFEELRAAGLHTVMMDFTGSFLLKKLVDVAPKPMAAAMFEQLRPHFLELSLHATACRVVQHMICHRDPLRHHLAMVAEALCGSVVRCVTDANASHVVQKLMDVYPAWGQKVAEELAADRLDTVACHAHGSRVLQRLFEQFTHQANVPATPISDVHAALAASGGGAPGAPLSTISERARRAMGVDLFPLAHHIARNARQYVFNQYGNHSVLAAMANVPPPLQRRFVEELLPLLPRLLRSSVALSVVECLFTLLTEDECTQAVGVLCKGNPPPVVWMLQDAHAQQIVAAVKEWIHVLPSRRSA